MHVNPTVIQRQRTMRTDENNAVKGHVAQTRNKQKTNKINVSGIPFNKSFMEDWNKNQFSQVTILKKNMT